MGQSPLAFVVRNFQKLLVPGQVGQQSDLWMTQRHGDWYNSSYGTPAIVSPATPAKAGTNFRCSNPTSVTLSAALALTYTGLCLSNPAGSALNLVVHRIAGVITAAPAAFLGIGLIQGWSAAGVTAHTTPLNSNIVNSYVGAAPAAGSILANAPVANVDAACTLVGTPAWDRWLVSNGASAGGFSLTTDIQDDLIVPPGGYIAIGATVAGPAGSFFTIGWEELSP